MGTIEYNLAPPTEKKCVVCDNMRLGRFGCTYPEEYPLKCAQLVANQMETNWNLDMPLLRDKAA
jgi:hypothetical protein